MSEPTNIKIVAFVGLPGSGKSTAVKYISEKQIPKVYFGSVILEAVSDAGLDINPKNEQYIREKIRTEKGDDVVISRIIDQINNLVDAGQKRIIADGLFTWEEYKILKKSFPRELTVVAVVAPRRTRHRRLLERPVRPMTEQEAAQNDWSGIESLQRGGPIAMADSYIINDGSIEDLYQKIDSTLNEIDFFI
jgi:dephospho-CoA kinase